MTPEILILALHRVGFPPKNATIRGLFTSPRLLSFQVRLLKLCGYEFKTLSDAMGSKHGRIAVITFDDGYLDNVQNALPVTRRLDVPATLFVVTNDVERRNVQWEEADEKLPADMLTWNDVLKLREAGWEIGSHCCEHVHLARRDKDTQCELITRSLDELESRLGQRPTSFAYPYGSYNGETLGILDQQGVNWAVTTRSPKQNLKKNDRLELPRLAVGGSKFHHYLRAVRRTASAIGILGPALRIAASLTAIAVRPLPSRKSANQSIGRQTTM